MPAVCIEILNGYIRVSAPYIRICAALGCGPAEHGRGIRIADSYLCKRTPYNSRSACSGNLNGIIRRTPGNHNLTRGDSCSAVCSSYKRGSPNTVYIRFSDMQIGYRGIGADICYKTGIFITAQIIVCRIKTVNCVTVSVNVSPKRSFVAFPCPPVVCRGGHSPALVKCDIVKIKIGS